MRPPKDFPLFTKALLACVLTGFFASIANGVYMIFYRAVTRFMPAVAFNFLSIPLVTMIVFIALGVIFFMFVRYFNSSAFIIALIIITVGCVAIATLLNGHPSAPAFSGNHGLIAGFVIISGLLSITLLPYFYKHPRIFI